MLLPRAGDRDAHARTIGRGEHDLAIVGGRRIGGVAHDVHEGLDEIVAIAPDRRQRRIEVLHDAQAAAEARLRHALHAVQHLVDVHRRAHQRHRIAKRLHPIDERANAIGFVADELRQRTVVGRNRVFEKLRRAADAGERILDLVRKHGRHAAHRTRGAAIKKLPVDALREAALLQQEDHPFFFAGGRKGHISQALAKPRRGEIDIALGDRGATLARLLHQLQQRTSEGEQIGKLLLQQEPHAHVEELLGRLIGIEKLVLGPDHEDWHGKSPGNSAPYPACLADFANFLAAGHRIVFHLPRS